MKLWFVARLGSVSTRVLPTSQKDVDCCIRTGRRRVSGDEWSLSMSYHMVRHLLVRTILVKRSVYSDSYKEFHTLITVYEWDVSLMVGESMQLHSTAVKLIINHRKHLVCEFRKHDHELVCTHDKCSTCSGTDRSHLGQPLGLCLLQPETPCCSVIP